MCALSVQRTSLKRPATEVDAQFHLHENLVAPLVQHRVHPVVEPFLPVLFREIVDHYLNQANQSTRVGAAGCLIADVVTTHEGLVLDNLLSS